MASTIEITVTLESVDTVLNPERVGKQAGDAIAKLMYETYELGARDEENPQVKIRAVSYRVSEAVTLPKKEENKRK